VYMCIYLLIEHFRSNVISTPNNVPINFSWRNILKPYINSQRFYWSSINENEQSNGNLKKNSWAEKKKVNLPIWSSSWYDRTIPIKPLEATLIKTSLRSMYNHGYEISKIIKFKMWKSFKFISPRPRMIMKY
jgi:hypothetical protein